MTENLLCFHQAKNQWGEVYLLFIKGENKILKGITKMSFSNSKGIK